MALAADGTVDWSVGAVEVPILPRRVLSFRSSQVLKARINGQPAPRDGEGEA